MNAEIPAVIASPPAENIDPVPARRIDFNDAVVLFFMFILGVTAALAKPVLRKYARPLLRWPALSLLLFWIAWRMAEFDYAHAGASALWTMALLAGFHVFFRLCMRRETEDAAHSSHAIIRKRELQILSVASDHHVRHQASDLCLGGAALRPGDGCRSLSSLAVAVPVSYLSHRLFEMKLAKTGVISSIDA